MGPERDSLASADRPRRRAAISCDYCKKRRARCVRSTPQDACANCVANNVECENKHARKQRVYGSIESLSLRFRALEALIEGLFPGEDTKSIDGLYRLAERSGIPLPSRDDESKAEGLFAEDSLEPQQIPPTTSPNPSRKASSVDEKLVPTASGVGHYVGPSSSFRFVGAIRRLVRDAGERPGGDPNSAMKQEFVTLRSSLALEHGTQDSSIPPRSSFNQATALAAFPALPPRDVSDALVTAFFDQLHPYYPLFNRQVFQLQYEAIWETGAPTLGTTDLGWSCCLALVLVFGMLFTSTYERCKESLLTFVRSSLGLVVGSASLVNVQALMLLQLYEHNSGQRNASWILLGCASRMAFALGMHLESATQSCVDDVERLCRVRVWWTLYNFERMLCLMLGRPSAIDDREVTVTWQALDSSGNDTNMPLRYAEYLSQLILMMGDLRQNDFCAPESDVVPEVRHARQRLARLEAWNNELPRHLRAEWKSIAPQHRRASLLLQIYYEHMVITVGRPFLLRQAKRKVRNISTTDADEEALRIACLTAADRMLWHCQCLVDENLLDTVGWLDVYFIYLGIFVLSLDLLSPGNVRDTGASDRNRQRRTIISLLEHLGRRFVAPTFHVLIKIAHQFAMISGALEEDSAEAVASAFSLDTTQRVPTDIHQVTEPFDLDGWLTEGLDLGRLDTFDMGAYALNTEPMWPVEQSWQSVFNA